MSQKPFTVDPSELHTVQHGGEALRNCINTVVGLAVGHEDLTLRLDALDQLAVAAQVLEGNRVAISALFSQDHTARSEFQARLIEAIESKLQERRQQTQIVMQADPEAVPSLLTQAIQPPTDAEVRESMGKVHTAATNHPDNRVQTYAFLAIVHLAAALMDECGPTPPGAPLDSDACHRISQKTRAQLERKVRQNRREDAGGEN